MARGRSKTVTKDDVYEACPRTGEPFGVGEVAAELPIGKERTRDILNELADGSVLNKKQIGRTNVYTARSR